MKKVFLFLVLIAIVVIGLLIFSKKTNPSPTSTSINSSTNINIENFAFNPQELVIKKGNTVTWTNNDSVTHQLSGNGFQSGLLNHGDIFKSTFETIGTFDYNCSIHPSMKGKVIVQ
jgi:plastocyanin